jgi:hypothetical protein
MKTSTTLMFVLVALLGYMLSPPFVGYVYISIDPTASKYPGLMYGLATFYAPLETLGEIFSPYRSFIEMIARNLGI